jgi:hypothetical protein
MAVSRCGRHTALQPAASAGRVAWAWRLAAAVSLVETTSGWLGPFGGSSYAGLVGKGEGGRALVPAAAPVAYLG